MTDASVNSESVVDSIEFNSLLAKWTWNYYDFIKEAFKITINTPTNNYITIIHNDSSAHVAFNSMLLLKPVRSQLSKTFKKIHRTPTG